jgi:outer membrane protein assembly factor BamB/phosphatidylglycerophosphate synthase
MWASFRGGPGNPGRSEVALGSGGGGGGSGGGSGVRSLRLGGLIWGSAVGADGVVFVGSTNRSFFCVDCRDAAAAPRVVWEHSLFLRADSLIDSAASLHPSGEQVVVPGGDGYLHALDAATGAVRWVFRASDGASDQEHESGVVVNSFEGNVKHSADGRHVLAGNDNGHFYCVDAATGAELWRFYAGPTMVWTLAAELSGGTNGADVLVFGALDGDVYALDAATGALLARHPTGADVKCSPCVAGWDAIFVGNSKGDARRLALEHSSSSSSSGWAFREVWQQALGDEVYSSPALVYAGSSASASASASVVFATMSGELTSLDAADGALRWTARIGIYTTCSPVVSRDGILVLGNSSGRLLALDAASGAQLGCLSVAPNDANLNASPMLMEVPTSQTARRPVVVIGSYAGMLHVVDAAALLGGRDAQTPRDPSQVLQRVANANGALSLVRCFRLNVRDAESDDADALIAGAAIDSRTVVVVPEDEADAALLRRLEVHVSPEGEFLNFIPESVGAAAALAARSSSSSSSNMRVRVTGAYYVRTRSWAGTHLLTAQGPAASGSSSIHTAAQQAIMWHVGGMASGIAPGRPPGDRGSFDAWIDLAATSGISATSATAGIHSSSSVNRVTELLAAGPSAILRMDASDMRVVQPVVTDTYIPAAADGQGFAVYLTDARPSGSGSGSSSSGTLVALAMPAIPIAASASASAAVPAFPIIPEPSKVVLLEGEFEGEFLELRARGGFTIASMGCTMHLAEFRLLCRFVSPTSVQMDLFARASCMHFKINGSSHKFCSDVVVHLCDRWLESRILGSLAGHCLDETATFGASGKPTTGPSMRKGSQSGPKDQRRLVVHLDAAKRVFEAAAYDAREPLPPQAAATPGPDCPNLTFVDGRLYSAGGAVMLQGQGQGRCWRPVSQGHGVPSTDAWFVSRPLRPVIDWACRVGLHPNWVTVSSMFVTVGMLFVPRASRAALWAVPSMMMYKWLADVLDGPIARRCDKGSRLGGALDMAADLLFIAVAYVLIMDRVFGRGRTPRVWAEGVLVALLPLAALLLTSGTRAVTDHGAFKDLANPFNATMWVLTENSFVLIAVVAIVFAAFPHNTSPFSSRARRAR